MTPRWDKCLNDNGDYVEVWCEPCATHMPCIDPSPKLDYKVFSLRMFGMFSGAFAKLRKVTVSFVMCVCVCVCVCVWPHGTTRPQMDGFVLHLIVA